MRLYKIISNLLDYPDREIIENLDELIQIIDNSFEINRSEKESLLTFINWMRVKVSLKFNRNMSRHLT